MTNEEAIKTALAKVEAQQDNFGFMDRFTVDEHWVVRDALEKQIPKEPVGHWGEFSNIFYTCPTCDKKLPKTRKMYCIKCGQCIDWT